MYEKNIIPKLDKAIKQFIKNFPIVIPDPRTE
jgi:hypothetical protein